MNEKTAPRIERATERDVPLILELIKVWPSTRSSPTR